MERFMEWHSFCFCASIATLYRLLALFLLYSETAWYAVARATWKGRRGAKVKSEDNLQGDSSFNGLLNMQFLFSYLVRVAKHQMTVLSRFGVHICITFWVELNVNKVYIPQATFFRGGCCIHPTLYLKIFSPLWYLSPLLRHPGDGPAGLGMKTFEWCMSGTAKFALRKAAVFCLVPIKTLSRKPCKSKQYCAHRC